MPTTSNPEYNQLYANMPTVKLMLGCIVTDTTTPTVKRGKGYTVSKPGTGRYLVTLNRRPGRIVSALGILRKAAGSATFLTGPVTDETNPHLVEFRVENASGTAADAGATDEIEFLIVVMRDKLPD